MRRTLSLPSRPPAATRAVFLLPAGARPLPGAHACGIDVRPSGMVEVIARSREHAIGLVAGFLLGAAADCPRCAVTVRLAGGAAVETYRLQLRWGHAVEAA